MTFSFWSVVRSSRFSRFSITWTCRSAIRSDRDCACSSWTKCGMILRTCGFLKCPYPLYLDLEYIYEKSGCPDNQQNSVYNVTLFATIFCYFQLTTLKYLCWWGIISKTFILNMIRVGLGKIELLLCRVATSASILQLLKELPRSAWTCLSRMVSRRYLPLIAVTFWNV